MKEVGIFLIIKSYIAKLPDREQGKQKLRFTNIFQLWYIVLKTALDRKFVYAPKKGKMNKSFFALNHSYTSNFLSLNIFLLFCTHELTLSSKERFISIFSCKKRFMFQHCTFFVWILCFLHTILLLPSTLEEGQGDRAKKQSVFLNWIVLFFR